jgi:hypothetical protein
MLVEQDRSALTASPKLLIDQRGTALADSAAKLSTSVAALLSAVQTGDGDGARRQIAALPFQKTS